MHISLKKTRDDSNILKGDNTVRNDCQVLQKFTSKKTKWSFLNLLGTYFNSIPFLSFCVTTISMLNSFSAPWQLK